MEERFLTVTGVFVAGEGRLEVHIRVLPARGESQFGQLVVEVPSKLANAETRDLLRSVIELSLKSAPPEDISDEAIEQALARGMDIAFGGLQRLYTGGMLKFCPEHGWVADIDKAMRSIPPAPTSPGMAN